MHVWVVLNQDAAAASALAIERDNGIESVNAEVRLILEGVAERAEWLRR
jgi:hypothetical protein